MGEIYEGRTNQKIFISATQRKQCLVTNGYLLFASVICSLFPVTKMQNNDGKRAK